MAAMTPQPQTMTTMSNISDLSEKDIAFAKGHLRKWCERTNNLASEQKIWEHFSKRLKRNFSRSWTDMAKEVGVL